METMTIQVLTTLYSHTGAVMMTATVMTILEKTRINYAKALFLVCNLSFIRNFYLECRTYKAKNCLNCRRFAEPAFTASAQRSLKASVLDISYIRSKNSSLYLMMRFLINTSIVQLLGLLIKTTPIRSCRLKNHIFGQISSVIVVV